jgi:hypothetical protein
MAISARRSAQYQKPLTVQAEVAIPGHEKTLVNVAATKALYESVSYSSFETGLHRINVTVTATTLSSASLLSRHLVINSSFLSSGALRRVFMGDLWERYGAQPVWMIITKALHT